MGSTELRILALALGLGGLTAVVDGIQCFSCNEMAGEYRVECSLNRTTDYGQRKDVRDCPLMSSLFGGREGSAKK